MAMLVGRIAFSLDQELKAQQQETLDDDLVSEAYHQRGLLLLSAETEEGRFRRRIDEYLLTDEAIGAIQGRDEVDSEQLERYHGEAAARHVVELHVSGGLEIESDLGNRDLSIPAGDPITPYSLPEEPIPIPAFILYWPTVTPMLSEEDVKPGEGWAASVAVQVGAGRFLLSYSVELVEYLDEDPILRISLNDQEPVSMVEDIALHLKPQGSWTVRISHEDGLWQEGEGEMTFRVRATYKDDEEDEEEIEVEVLAWTNKFAVKRIPVTFDDEKIYPAEWKAEPVSAPSEADDAAGEGGGQAGERPAGEADSETPPSSPDESGGSEQESGGEAEDGR